MDDIDLFIQDFLRFTKEEPITEAEARKLYNKYPRKKTKPEETTKSKELKKILPINRQGYFSKMTQWKYCERGNSLSFLNQAINFLRSDIGDEPLKKVAKDFDITFERLLKRLEIFSDKVSGIQFYYDRMKEIKDEKEIERYRKEFKGVMRMQKFVWCCHNALLECSVASRLRIPREYDYMEKQQKYKDMGFLKEKVKIEEVDVEKVNK